MDIPKRASDSYHLLSHHDHRLYREPSVAMIKQIFERRTEEVDHQDVVEAFLAKVIDIRDTSCEGVSCV